MALRRWVNLARYDGAAMLIAAQCPPDGRNRLVVRGYNRSDLSAFGFERVAPGLWLGDKPSFKTSDLQAWFPGFDARRDLAEMDTASFLIGYEDLDLVDDTVTLDALIKGSTPPVSPEKPPSYEERIAAIRSAVSPADVLAIVSTFPKEDAAAAFDDPIEERTRKWYIEDFAVPKAGGKKALSHIDALIEAAVRELASDVARYNDLRTGGVGAISDYDLVVAYSGDALMALRQSLRTKESHILFQRRKLVVLREVAATIDAGNEAVEAPPVPQVDGNDEKGSAPIPADEVAPRGRTVKSAERQRARIEDAGEKIGGARKDFYAKSLSHSDLEEMNEREKLELVTRDNIWPRKSMDEFREEGIDCRVALFVNALRKDLPPKISDPAHAAAYIELVTKVRDCAAELSVPEDVTVGSHSPFEAALQREGVVDVTDNGYSISRAVKTEYQAALRGDPKGWRFIGSYLMSPSRAYWRAKALYDGHSFRVGDEWVSPSKMDSEELYAFIEQRQARANEKRAKTMASREEDDNGDYLSRPHLDHLRRTGAPDERGGRDIKPEDFLETFGFRACEFGNWLPDIERQDVLNRAYDSLSTLANILGVEKTFLSLGGSLALAFGSRGVGRAMAHYEPARKVTNLTRLNGAGALAHEFFHALDDHLGEHLREVLEQSSGRATMTDAYYATELFLTQKRVRRDTYRTNEIAQSNYVPADLRDQFEPLISAVNALSIRRFTEEEAKSMAERRLAGARYEICNMVRGVLNTLRPDQGHTVQHSTAERMAEEIYQEIAEDRRPRLRPGERHPLVERLAGMRPASDVSRATANELSRALVELDRAIKMLPETYETAMNRDALLQSEYMSRLVNTKYFKDAEKFDEKKSKPYWSSVREMAARGFEAYVQDRCEERGWRDDYLVHGTEESRFEVRPNAPYPVGDERHRINEAFDRLVAFVKSELAAQSVSEDVEPVTPRPKAA